MALATLLLVSLMSMTPAQAASAADDLPSLDCLRALRSARVARMLEQPDEELSRLQSASTPCGERLELSVALLDYHRRIGFDQPEHDLAHAQLLQRLAASEGSISTAVATRLLHEPDLDEQIVSAVASTLERAIEAEQSVSPLALRALARAFLRLERVDGAIGVLERLVGREDESTWADWKLLELYGLQERWSDEADAITRLADRALAIDPTWRVRQIESLVRAGRFDEAERLIDAELSGGAADESSLAEHRFLPIAWSLRDAGRHAAAERLFRRVLENPAPRAVTMPATTATERDFAPGASDTRSQARLALAYFYADQDERASLLADQTVPADDSDPFALYEAGTQHLTSGQFDQAFELLARAAPGLPELEAAWFNLALVAYRLERWQEAADAYEHAAGLNPTRPDAWFFRGLALVNLERCDGAVEPLLRALELDPDRELAHYHLGRCYAQLGDADAAARHRAAYARAREQKGQGQ